MSPRLILVRHGETFSNVLQKLDTRPPGAELTERGRQQAQALAVSARGRTLAALVSSVAVRARQTSLPVAESTGLDLLVREGIHEIQAGELEDRSDMEAHRSYTQTYIGWQYGDLDLRNPGAESGHDVLDRYLPVVAELRRTYLEQGAGDVLVVSHGAVIRLVAARLAGIDPAFAIGSRLENTAAVELAPTSTGWELVSWGRTVDPAAPPRPAPGDVMG